MLFNTNFVVGKLLLSVGKLQLLAPQLFNPRCCCIRMLKTLDVIRSNQQILKQDTVVIMAHGLSRMEITHMPHMCFTRDIGLAIVCQTQCANKYNWLVLNVTIVICYCTLFYAITSVH